MTAAELRRLLELVLERLDRIERVLAGVAADTDDLHRARYPHGDGEPLHRRRMSRR